MYSRETLEKSGIKPAKLKQLSEGLTISDRESPFAKWVDREASRIRDGVDRNLNNWRLWWALDRAYDAPFHQISFTLMQDILEKDYDEKSVESLVNDFGLAHMMEPVLNSDGSTCCDANGTPKKALNLPVFFKIFVPLCAAYLKARWSKLYNDRDQHPRYKYEPAYSTPDNRLRCDIWTSRVALMTTQYGYANDDKDAIFNALHYGMGIQFPREAWHREYYTEEGKDKVAREGLRFNIPPPERTYYDLSERLSQMNYGMGPAFAGYWHIAKLGDIKSGDYWNKDKISYGEGVDIISASPNFFANIYPCTLKFPSVNTSEEENDREIEYNYYASAEDDTAVLVTEHFTTVIPKDVGLGNYEHPVKFRMVMFNYDTVAFIEPMFCGFGAYFGYDSEGNRAKNASLTLEIMPFQDHVGNILTNWILAAKQNLIAPTFVDNAIVPPGALAALKNQGEKVLRGRQFIEFNSRDMQAAMTDKREAFYSPAFALLPTGEMQQLVRGLIDILERALGFSPQEIGQAASHEQSATESNIINNNVGNRVAFTGTYMDEGIWGKKKMIYDASVANMDDDITAELSPSYATSLTEFAEMCKKVGVELLDRAGNNGEKVVVRASANKIRVEAFSSQRDGTNRVNNPAVASAAAQVFQSIAGNEALLMAVGPQQLIELANHISALLDLPKDFRLRYQPPREGQGNSDFIKQVQQQFQQLAEQVAKRIEQTEQGAAKAIQEGDKQLADGIGQVAQQAAQRFDTVEKELQSVAQAIQQIGQKISQAAQPPPQQAMMPAPGMA